MRGFKAKALRKLAQVMEPDSFGKPEYIPRKPGRLVKYTADPTGGWMPYYVTTPIVDHSKGNRLYKAMKRDLTHG